MLMMDVCTVDSGRMERRVTEGSSRAPYSVLRPVLGGRWWEQDGTPAGDFGALGTRDD